MDWLKPLLLLFYAPGRALGAVRERAPLGAGLGLALLAQAALTFNALWPFIARSLARSGGWVVFALLRDAAGTLFLLAFVFVPALVLFANWFERRGSYRLVLQQEFVALATGVCYAWAAANLVALPLLALARRGGLEASTVAQSRAFYENAAAQHVITPEDLAQLLDPRLQAELFARSLVVPFFAIWAVLAVRAVFRISWPRALAVVVGGGVALMFVSPLVERLGSLLSSPFLLLLVFFFLRNQLGDLMQAQRARAAFRQNLEAATLNPADASAHYNLGLIHQQRHEYDAARARFRRAIEIDPEEVDAHYQLGRIGRAEGKLAEAIEHFGQVVTRAPQHAQHEVWREIGATYLAAGQHADALDALDRFLDQRPSDPEGLYLKGRALAGLGRPREAAEAMRACIEAVRTAPAYKYRADKRWLNEAQQFLRTQT
ncbi:MAG TPA: tetratricopeptide repeat protein [Pyrinomonadaceae bacterium]|jgi:tetratricopeptide (TPR) repeat protein